MILAERLSMSLQEARVKTTSTEFNLWMAYFEEEVNYFHRDDRYLARIALEIRAIYNSLAGLKKKLQMEDFVLKFKPKKGKKGKKKGDGGLSVEAELRMKDSKRMWLGLVGLKGK